MKSSQKNAKPSIRQAMLLGGSLVLAGAAQAGMVTDPVTCSPSNTLAEVDAMCARFRISGLPVIDPERCTACGDCVDACPRALITLEPLDHRLWVACRNRISSNTATDVCEVACTACGRCVADAAPGLIRLEDGLAVIAADQRQAASRTRPATRRRAAWVCASASWSSAPAAAERASR